MTWMRSFAASFGALRRRPPHRPERDSIADEVLARAEAAVDALSAEYPAHAMRDILRLIQLTERFDADGRIAAPDYDEILRIAHDMRGQGAIFGFPMMTRCAGSLCRATRTFEPDHRAMPGIVRTHVAALYAVLNCGAGPNDCAAAVAGGLELLVEASRERPSGQ